MENAKKLIIGNWKMNPASAALAKRAFGGIAAGAGKFKNVETVVCPPYPFIGLVGAKKAVKLGGQDAHFEAEGAYTGSVSAKMLKDLGAEYAIIGHSERRRAGDTDEIVGRKLAAALKEGLKAVLCIGEESHDEAGAYLKDLERQIGRALEGVNKKHFKQVVIAHEPVWAIGADAKGADTPESFQHNRLFIKKVLSGIMGKKAGLAVPILYGGSANAKNAAGFLGEGEADGLLVGRASLNPAEFLKIVEIASKL